MSVVTKDVMKSLESETIRCLGDGVDTRKLDDFLDLIFALAGQFGNIGCTPANERVLRVQSGDRGLQDVDIPLGKTKLRMLSARLPARCTEWANRSTSPYGDTVGGELPPRKGL